MEINLDEAIDAVKDLLPWDLTLIIKGAAYATTRPSVADIGRLLGMRTVSEREIRGRVKALFADPAPDVSDWLPEQLGAVLAAYLAYYNAQIPKKAGAIAASLAGAMAGGERDGTNGTNGAA